MTLRWTERAKEDVLEIGRFIARDNPQAAGEVMARIRTRARAAARFPRSGRVVPELKRPDVRELIEGNHRIVYRALAGAVEVLTVFEGHRLLSTETET